MADRSLPARRVHRAPGGAREGGLPWPSARWCGAAGQAAAAPGQAGPGRRQLPRWAPSAALCLPPDWASTTQLMAYHHPTDGCPALTDSRADCRLLSDSTKSSRQLSRLSGAGSCWRGGREAKWVGSGWGAGAKCRRGGGGRQACEAMAQEAWGMDRGGPGRQLQHLSSNSVKLQLFSCNSAQLRLLRLQTQSRASLPLTGGTPPASI